MTKPVRRMWWLASALLVALLAACQSPAPTPTTPAEEPASPQATQAQPAMPSPEGPKATEPMQEKAMDEDMDEEPKAKAGLSPELQQRAQQIYIQQGCLSCHGANYEGRTGPMLAGLPEDEIKAAVRNGFPEAAIPMPAYSPQQLSDEDLDLLAQFLSQLTLEDIGVEIPEAVRKHLELAWQALEQEDKAAVETHLKAALEALPEEGNQGLKVSLEDLVEDLEEPNWKEALEHHLVVLVGAEAHDE